MLATVDSWVRVSLPVSSPTQGRAAELGRRMRGWGQARSWRRQFAPSLLSFCLAFYLFFFLVSSDLGSGLPQSKRTASIGTCALPGGALGAGS